MNFRLPDNTNKTAWATSCPPYTRLLVWDRNGNGVIDDGSELFGEDTPTKYGDPVTDGFTALQTVESHPDGEINAKDHEWKNLKVWRDLNQDGKTQKGELFLLDKLRISANNEFFAQYTTAFQAA